jgi:hypothetical protein
MRAHCFRLFAVVIPLVLCGGCAVRQSGSYRVVKSGSVHYLLTPAFQGDLSHPGRDLRVRVAGVARPGAGGCAIAGIPEFTLTRRGSAVEVKVSTAELFAGGGTIRAFRGVFLRFRTELASLEESGCLVPGGGRAVSERVAESLPAPLMEAQYYAWGYDPFRGYCEVHPGMRLHAQRPLLERGPDGKERLVRIDRAVYEVSRRGGEGLGFRLEEKAGTEAAMPGLERMNRPFYRFFYFIKFKPGQDGSAQRSAVLLGAPGLNQLEQTTAKLWNDPDLTCSGALTAIDCFKSPNGQMVTPEVPVRINGKRALVSVNFTLLDVVRDHARWFGKGPFPAIEMRKTFRGRPAKVEFLSRETAAYGVPVSAGDRIEWKPAPAGTASR